MISRRLLILFTALLLFLNGFSQRVTNDKILHLEAHPSEEGKFIAKFFDKTSHKIIEHWEMRTLGAEIDANNFNDLLNENMIIPDGICYKFYPNVRLKSEVNYKNGFRYGEEKGYYEDRRLKYRANFNSLQENATNFFYKNGVTKRTEIFTNGRLNGEVKEFYSNGKKKSIANFTNGKIHGKFQSFYLNGEVKRKAKFEYDKELQGKCFDENRKIIQCPPIYCKPSYPGGFSSLKDEIKKLDFGFNATNTDTANFRIILKIDTLGLIKQVNYDFKHADSLQITLQEWGNSLFKFSPALVDNAPVYSYLNISFSVSADKIVWLGEPTLNHAIFTLNSEVEKLHTWFWSFPNPTSNEVFYIVDVSPEFPGGEKQLQKFITDHIQYPEDAQKQGLEGKVFVSFIVEKDGSVSNKKIVKAAHPELNDEALRVLKYLPKFTPGTLDGEPVRVSLATSVNFILNKRMSLGTSVETIRMGSY